MENKKTKKKATVELIDVVIQNADMGSEGEKTIREKAADLLAKHPEYEGMILANYAKKIIQMTEGGSVDFDPDGLKEVVNGEKLTYNDYIDAQINAIGKTHSGFQCCFYNHPLGFKGQVERISNGHICFQRIFIDLMDNIGDCLVDSEQHIWMDLKGFEGLQPGDCIEFFAEPYRYLKTGSGKQIDFGLCNPSGVKKIDKYDLPSDDELVDQELGLMLCDTCYLSENCNRTVCMNSDWRKKTKESMKDLLKKKDEQ